MNSILGVVIARDEVATLPKALASFKQAGVPFIAILDNPTKEVRWILRAALDTYEMPPCEGDHVYRWEKILYLMEWALKRPRSFDWAWRIDADEVWPDIRPDVDAAEEAGMTAINYGVCNHSPSCKLLGEGEDFISKCPPSLSNDPLYLNCREMPYQRVWSLSSPWSIVGGGHIVQPDKRKVHESPQFFDHYPAVDFDSLDKKLARKYLASEKKKDWHLQYDLLIESRKPKPPKRNIQIFYHVAYMEMDGLNSLSIFQEQMKAIMKSGLLKEAEITIGWVGDDQRQMIDFCSKGSSMNPIYSGSLHNYEFPTLKRMWDWCQKNPEDIVLYLHTKGASKLKNAHIKEWRDYMMWGCVEEWKRCVRALQEGHQMSGVEWTAGNDLFKWGCTDPQPLGFWAGNFFWAKASYINTLPDPFSLDMTNRFYAEAWSGLAKEMPKVACFHDTRKHQTNSRRGWSDPKWGRRDYA